MFLKLRIESWAYVTSIKHADDLAPVPLAIFRLNLKFDRKSQCSSLKCANPSFEILHMSRYSYCRDVCRIYLWSAEYVMNDNITKFHWISNSIEISLMGWGPGGVRSHGISRHGTDQVQAEYHMPHVKVGTGEQIAYSSFFFFFLIQTYKVTLYSLLLVLWWRCSSYCWRSGWNSSRGCWWGSGWNSRGRSMCIPWGTPKAVQFGLKYLMEAPHLIHTDGLRQLKVLAILQW